MTTGFDWAIVLDVGVGLGIFLGIGIGGLWIASSLSRTLRRLDRTFDVVDEQVSAIGVPVRDTLTHVGGIVGTADETVARLTGVVSSLEDVAGSVAQTAKLAQNAVSPALVNVGAAIGGVTAGLRRLVRGGDGSVEER